MTLLVVFLLSGALGIVVWLLIPPQEDLLDRPHVQPTLILRPGVPPAEDLQRSLRIQNIGSVDIYDLELIVRTDQVTTSDANHLIHPRNLPPKGKLSINIPALAGIVERRFLEAVVSFRASLNGSDRNFSSTYTFLIPDIVGGQLEIDPSSFSESVGKIQEGPRAAQIAKAFSEPEGTIMMVVPDELNGKPNHTYVMTTKRGFTFDPVAHTVAFKTTGQSKSRVINKTLMSDRPHNAHLITLRWKDSDDSGDMLVDSKDHAPLSSLGK